MGVCIVWNSELLASGGQSSHKLFPHIIYQFLCAREKTLNEDLFYEGSSASLPCLHTCENKVPFWDFKEFAVKWYIYSLTSSGRRPNTTGSCEFNQTISTVHYEERTWQWIIFPRCINGLHGARIQVIPVSKANIYRTVLTATCLPSRKLSKLDEPDTQDTAGEAGTSS